MMLTAPDWSRFGAGERPVLRSPLSLRVPGKREKRAGPRVRLAAAISGPARQPANQQAGTAHLGSQGVPTGAGMQAHVLGFLGTWRSSLQDPAPAWPSRVIDFLLFQKFTWHVSLAAGRRPTPLGFL